MDQKKVCVFCGKKLSAFRYDIVYCGGVVQLTCKECKEEIDALSDEERCRRALRYGRADQPEKIEAHLALSEEAEKIRPHCLRCGGKMRYGELLTLDNSPLRDSIFSDTFDVIPVYCGQCGKIEFFHHGLLSENKKISYLMKKDRLDNEG